MEALDELDADRRSPARASRARARCPRTGASAAPRGAPAKYAEDQEEDEEVVERERALDEVDGRVVDRAPRRRRGRASAARRAGRARASRATTRRSRGTTGPARARTAAGRRAAARGRAPTQPAERDGAVHDPERRHAKKKARANTRYTARSWTPSNHVDSPSFVTWLAMSDRQEDRPELEAVEDERHAGAGRARTSTARGPGRRRARSGRSSRSRCSRRGPSCPWPPRGPRPSARRRCRRGHDDDADEELAQSPIVSEASEIEPTRISDMTPTATPASASAPTALPDRPRLAVLASAAVGAGVEEAAVRPQREDQAGHVGEDQDDRHRERQLLDRACRSSRARRRAAAGPGPRPARRSRA